MKSSLKKGLFFCIIALFFPLSVTHASASISISSATLASDGKTLTVTMTGVTGSLSPGTSITGFTVRSGPLNNGDVEWFVSSATSAASTVTLTLNTFVPSGTTLVLDLTTSSGSNLTDTGSNTPTGQTGVSVTNNSNKTATSFAYGDANFSFVTATLEDSSFNTRFVKVMRGGPTGDFFETTVVGTDAQVLLISGVANASVVVDGGATTTIAIGGIPANQWTWVKLFSGLSDGPHTVKVFSTAGAIYFSTTNTIQVIGSSPATQKPTGFGTYIDITHAISNTNVVLDGSVAVTDVAYWRYGDASVRFRGSITDLWAYILETDSRYFLYQDGVQVGSFTVNSSSQYDLVHIVSGLDNQPHDYELVSSGDASVHVAGLMLTGTGFLSNSYTTKSINTWYGDSITSGLGLTNPQDGRQLSSWIVSRAIGAIGTHVGEAGTRVSTYGRDNTAYVTSYTVKPSRVWVRYGYNDAANSVSIGSVGSAGTFMGDYYSMLTSLRAGLSASAPLMIEKILPTVGFSAPTRTAYNNAIDSVVSTYITNTGDTNIKVINTDNWINTTINQDVVDSTGHPSAAGYIKIANRELPYASTTGYTVSGPTSGHMSASTNFTVTLANTATFTGDQTITISDGGHNGVFTPSVGTPGTGTVTVTPTNALTSFTFTYTPAVIGTTTLSFTNAQNWGDASSTSYAVTSAPGAPTSVTATAGNAIATIGFSAPASDGGVSITAYTVTSSPGGITASGSGSPIVVSNLTNGTAYTFTVTATNSVGVSNASNPSSSVTPVSPGGGGPIGLISGGGSAGPTVPSRPQIITPDGKVVYTDTSAQKAISPTPQSYTSSVPFSRDLTLDSVGDDVYALQQFLNTHGYPIAFSGPGSPGHETKKFGFATQYALKRYQSAQHISPATGYLGPKTRKVIGK